MELSKRDARKLFLKQQGLLRRSTFGRGKKAALAALKKLSYLQIDTISVVNRAHEHILASRIDNYTPRMLDRLIGDRQVLEYWSHAAAYLPFEHYRNCLPVMKGFAENHKHDRKLAAAILDRIRHEGPLSSKDFEDTRASKKSGWWDWKPAKMALEHLFLSGELMVSRRDGFQKVYDLPERVIPASIDISHPTISEWSHHIVGSMMNALGVATEYDLSYARPTIRKLSRIDLRKPIQSAIEEKLESGEFLEVDIEGATYLTTDALLDELPLRATKKEVKFLSPFDNLVINRRRTSKLFDFDYQLECYLPAEKRKYGYFALPALLGDDLIGRMDAKADRGNNALIIRNLVLEDDTRISDELISAMAHGIRTFADQHLCEHIKIEGCDPASLGHALNTTLGEGP